MHLYHLPIILRGLIRMNSIFGSACKVSTGCSGVCYGCKTLTDPQTTPFPINRTKCPTALQTHTWWNMSHKRWQYEIYIRKPWSYFWRLWVVVAASHVDLPSCLQHLAAPSSPNADSHVCAYHCHRHITVCMYAIHSTQLKRPQERWKVCMWHFMKMWKCGNENLCSRNVSSLCSSPWPRKGAFSNKYRRNCPSKKTHRKELVFRKVEQHFERKVIQGNLSINVINCI